MKKFVKFEFSIYAPHTPPLLAVPGRRLRRWITRCLRFCKSGYGLANVNVSLRSLIKPNKMTVEQDNKYKKYTDSCPN